MYKQTTIRKTLAILLVCHQLFDLLLSLSRVALVDRQNLDIPCDFDWMWSWEGFFYGIQMDRWLSDKSSKTMGTFVVQSTAQNFGIFFIENLSTHDTFLILGTCECWKEDTHENKFRHYLVRRENEIKEHKKGKCKRVNLKKAIAFTLYVISWCITESLKIDSSAENSIETWWQSWYHPFRLVVMLAVVAVVSDCETLSGEFPFRLSTPCQHQQQQQAHHK